MSSIRTYEDLEAEEKRLQLLLHAHKKAMGDSYASLKQSLNPFKRAADSVSKMFHRDGTTSPLMRLGLDMSVDVLIRRFLLARAGWFTKIVIPFIIRNYSTHVVKNRKVIMFFKKVQSYFKDGKKDAPVTPTAFRENRSNNANAANDTTPSSVD